VHISEGVLSAPVLAIGGGLAAAGVGIGLRKLDYERVPQVAMLSAAFFVASLVHVPLGLSSAHLVLNGLVGLVLGWAAFPAVFIALVLQAVLFGFGGLSVLGVNTVVMGAPALCCNLLFGRWLPSSPGPVAFGLGFAAGVLGILGSCLFLAVGLVATGREFAAVACGAVVAHLPIAVAEGFITGAVIVFLLKVRPELIEAPLAQRTEGRLDHA
jgi:cobalt/nickel transport system permease protein